MTLNINVNVNNPGLLDKNKTEADANRQVNLVDKPDQNQAETVATEQREKRLEESGSKPDGKKKRRGKPPQTYYPIDVAANRFQGYSPALGYFKYEDDSETATRTITIYSSSGNFSLSKQHKIISENRGFQFKWDLDSYDNLINEYGEWFPAPPLGYETEGDSVMTRGTLIADSPFPNPLKQWLELSPIRQTRLIYTSLRGNQTDLDWQVICLPISSRRFVLYYIYHHDIKQQYFGYIKTRVEQIVSFGQVDMGDYVWGFSGTGTVYGPELTEGLSDEFDETYEDSFRQQYCFLVGPELVKEIPVPDTLSQSISKLYPSLAAPIPVPTTQVYWVELRNPTYALAEPNYQGQLIEVTSPGIENIYRTIYDSIAYQDLKNLNYPSVYLDLLAGYGLAELVDSIHYPYASFYQASGYFTPAIFSLIKNAESIRSHPYDIQFENYSYIYENYLKETPFRGLYLNAYLDYNYLYGIPLPEAALPVDITTPIDPQNLRRNPTRFPPFFGDGDKLLAWNWENTGYCLSKLSEFGFPPEDLTFEPL